MRRRFVVVVVFFSGIVLLNRGQLVSGKPGDDMLRNSSRVVDPHKSCHQPQVGTTPLTTPLDR